ncbi:MAG: hypothetical protein QOK89_06990 [Nitrososphaeraceae archaeon]|nr:hypothetical protein [Nitrososphaeraceae archaeon]
MINKGYIRYICLFIIISFAAANILFVSSSSSYYELAFAKKSDKDGKDQLIVKARIHLANIDMDKTKFLRVTAFINGDDFKQDIPISSIDKTKKTITVDLKTDVDNDIVSAHSPDEFFVCAYQVGNVLNDYNSFPKFDCNESDLVNIDKPTVINLFRSGSLVYTTSKAIYDASLNQPTLPDSDTIKIKILAPLADKKDTKKLVIAAMIKGQIQSEVIEDVQAELDKSKDSTIKRTFTFDRKTDIGLIQIGDRYHACVASEDLRPPEGSECEKRIVKNLAKVSGLYAR